MYYRNNIPSMYYLLGHRSAILERLLGTLWPFRPGDKIHRSSPSRLGQIVAMYCTLDDE